MDIIGLGVDLAEVGRIRDLLGRYGDAFRERCFTDHEWKYAHRFSDPAGRLAARFAGKEAVMKSLGTGWRRLRWTDIEITGGGRPRAILSGRAAIRAEMLGVSEVLVTVTHTRDQAVVLAIAVGIEV
jgi:holo-[acyl-carrier protein] synthase